MYKLLPILFSIFIHINTLALSVNIESFFTQKELSLSNTAYECDYLKKDEKSIIQIINLARVYPIKFSVFYLEYLKKDDYSGYQKFKKKDKYYYSLYKILLKLKKVKLTALKPNRSLHTMAKCWAIKSGKRGSVGHNTGQCKGYYQAECCNYGLFNPEGHVLNLLIDENIRDFGHRNILFSPYSEIGVSLQDHKKYGTVLVIEIL